MKGALSYVASIPETRYGMRIVGAVSIGLIIILLPVSEAFHADWLATFALIPLAVLLFIALVGARDEIVDCFGAVCRFVRISAKAAFWLGIILGTPLVVYFVLMLAPRWLTCAVGGWAVVMGFFYWLSKTIDYSVRSAARNELSHRGL